MNKNKFAITPPMDWNSYDYYDTSPTKNTCNNFYKPIVGNVFIFHVFCN